MYDWDFAVVWAHRARLLQGLLVTLELNAVVLLCGSAVGAFLGVFYRCEYRLVRLGLRIYVDLFRALPLLVLLIWFYFCVPILAGLRLSGFTCAVVVLSLNLSAFIAEIVRAGIEAVPRCHVDDALALGLDRPDVNLHVRLPLALRIMVPPLVGQYMNSIKLSVLASIIGVPELYLRTTDSINKLSRPLEFYTVLALLFLSLLLPGTVWSRRLEKGWPRLGLGGSR